MATRTGTITGATWEITPNSTNTAEQLIVTVRIPLTSGDLPGAAGLTSQGAPQRGYPVTPSNLVGRSADCVITNGALVSVTLT